MTWRRREPLTRSEDARRRRCDPTRSATVTAGGLRRDGGGAALPARGGAEGAPANWARPTAAGGGVRRRRAGPGTRGPAATSLAVRLDEHSLGVRECGPRNSAARHAPAAAAPAPRSPIPPVPRAGPAALPHSRAEGGAPSLEFDPGAPRSALVLGVPWRRGAATPRLFDLAKGS